MYIPVALSRFTRRLHCFRAYFRYLKGLLKCRSALSDSLFIHKVAYLDNIKKHNFSCEILTF